MNQLKVNVILCTLLTSLFSCNVTLTFEEESFNQETSQKAADEEIRKADWSLDNFHKKIWERIQTAARVARDGFHFVTGNRFKAPEPAKVVQPIASESSHEPVENITKRVTQETKSQAQLDENVAKIAENIEREIALKTAKEVAEIAETQRKIDEIKAKQTTQPEEHDAKIAAILERLDEMKKEEDAKIAKFQTEHDTKRAEIDAQIAAAKAADQDKLLQKLLEGDSETRLADLQKKYQTHLDKAKAQLKVIQDRNPSSESISQFKQLIAGIEAAEMAVRQKLNEIKAAKPKA